MASSPAVSAPSARVLSVQVGRARDYEWLGRPLRSAIVKHPVHGPVEARATGLVGDEQSDLAQHGGLDKAVYAYAREDLDWWEAELGRELPCGVFGENLTLVGVDLVNAAIGEEWSVGTTLLQVSEPRTPCWKLGMRMGDKLFPRAFTRARRPGVMLRILRPGHLRAGDPVAVRRVPGHGVTAAEVTAMYLGDPVDARRVLAAPQLARHWQEWATHRTIWHLDEERKRGEW